MCVSSCHQSYFYGRINSLLTCARNEGHVMISGSHPGRCPLLTRPRLDAQVSTGRQCIASGGTNPTISADYFPTSGLLSLFPIQHQ